MQRNFTKRFISFTLMLVMVLGVFTFIPNTEIKVYAVDYNGFMAEPTKDPIPTDAIHIKTAEELAKIGGEQSEGKYYALDNDIDLTSEWIPIDDFRGTFDGRGYIVNSMLFLTVYDAIIKNVGVTLDGKIETRTSLDPAYAGGLVGYFSSGTIENCYIVGDISARSSYNMAYSGGLIGFLCDNNSGTISISNCYAIGNIYAGETATYSASNYAGGLIGRCDSSGTIMISNCYFIGDVFTNGATSSDSSAYAGGLVGLCYYTGLGTRIIKNCYFVGNVSANARHRNINSGMFETSPPAYAGGMVGWYYQDGRVNYDSTIENCYVIGDVFAQSYCSAYAGGIVGSKSNITTVKNCYRLSTQTITGSTINESGTPLTDAQMKKQSSFVEWDFDNIWKVDSSKNNGYPYLRELTDTGNSGNNINLDYIFSAVAQPNIIYIDSTGVIQENKSTLRVTVDNFPTPPIDGFPDYTVKELEDMSIKNLKVTITLPNGVKFADADKQNLSSYTANYGDIAFKDIKTFEYDLIFDENIKKFTDNSFEILITVTSDNVANKESKVPFNIIRNIDKGENYLKLAGDFISKNCTLLYSPIIDGKTYYHYQSAEKKVVFQNNNFSFILDSERTNDYLLDTSYKLVIDPRVIVKAVYLHNLNGDEGLKHNYRNGTQSISTLQSELQNILSIENEYQKALTLYNIGDTLVKVGNFTYDLSIAAGKFLTCNVKAPFKFIGTFVIDKAVDFGTAWLEDKASLTVSVEDMLRDYTKQAYSSTITYYENNISMLSNSANFDNNFLRSYENAVSLNEAKYLFDTYIAYGKMDIKYLANKIENASNTTAILSQLEKLLKGILDLKYDNEELNKWIDVSIKIFDGGVIVTTDIKTALDPDIIKMFERIEIITNAFNSSLLPIESIDLFGNLGLIGITSKFDQAIIIDCPINITVYNKQNQIIGKITDNVIDETILNDINNLLIIAVYGEAKVLIFPQQEDYKIEITATDVGLMSYFEKRIDKNGVEISNTNIYDIPLETGDIFSVNDSFDSIDYTILINELSFTDVKKTDWFYEYVKEAVSLGIVNGRSKTIFDPFTPASYVDTVAMFLRAMEISPDTINISDWSKPYIDKAISLGIYDSNWKASDIITRERMAMILANSLKMLSISKNLTYTEINEILKNFTDKDKLSDEAKESMAICVKEGLIVGVSASEIAPQSNFTRVQMATIAVRFSKLL